MKGEEDKILKEILEDQNSKQAPFRHLDAHHPSPKPLSPSEIPVIIATAPSTRTPQGLNSVPARALGSSPHFAESPVSPGEKSDDNVVPSPTMFPYTQEIYHHEPFPHIADPVQADSGIPSPNPLNVPQKPLPNAPTLTPIPSPLMLEENNKLSEADAEVIDVWFFRDQLPETVAEDAALRGGLIKWEFIENAPRSPGVPG